LQHHAAVARKIPSSLLFSFPEPLMDAFAPMVLNISGYDVAHLLNVAFQI
jgi:hypothetical protein